MDHPSPFGTLLRRQRKLHDLTQQALAQAAFCSLDTIKKLESGLRRPSRQLAAQLADVLALDGAARADFLAAARRVADVPSPNGAAIVDAAPASLAGPAAITRRLPFPHSLTPFIGRERELSDLLSCLDAPHARLVTLLAPGGMGKTRLALAAVEQLSRTERFLDGVAVADLASLAAAAPIEPCLAAALDLPLAGSEASARTPRRQILDYLREKRLLILLDNCEHLLDAIADLAGAILAETTAVTLLATSRERLGLRAERPFPLDGLESAGDGVALFVAIARIARPGLQLDEQAHSQVAAICARLGGMPLAIELAAGWADTLSPAEISAELERGDQLLIAQRRDMPARHRSMRAVCEATWARLRPPEQQIFARLAVFRGGGTLRALQAVTGASLGQIQALTSKSLISFDPARERYMFHELLRQYAEELLADDPAMAAQAYERHAGYYLTGLAGHEAQLKGAQQMQALNTISADIENISVAWRWAAEIGRADLIAGAIHPLGFVCEWQGRYDEGMDAFTRALQVFDIDQGSPSDQALTWAWAGAFARLRGDRAAAQRALDAALNLIGSPVLGVPPAVAAFVLLQLGHLQLRNDSAAAEHTYRRSLELARAGGDLWLIATALAGLGSARFAQTDFAASEACYQESLQLGRALGGPKGIAEALATLAQIAFHQGRLADNVQLAQESYDLMVGLGNRAMAAYGTFHLACALQWVGEWERSAGLLSTAAAGFRELGNQVGLIDALLQHGGVLLFLGRYDAAEADLRASLASAERLNDQKSGGICRWLLAGAALGRGAYDLAEAEALAAITLLEQQQQMDHAGRAYGIIALVERIHGRTSRAWGAVAAGLRIGLQHRSFMTIVGAIRAAALLLADAGDVERAVELGELNRSLNYGKWVEDLYYQQLDTHAATLAPDRAAAARQRGRARDPWAAAGELLEEIEVLVVG